MAEGEDQFLQIVFWLSYSYCGTHTPIHKQVNKCNKTRWYWYLPKITKMKGQMVPAIDQVWWHTPVIQYQGRWRLAPSSRPSSDFKFSLASWDFVSIYIPYIYHTHIYVCVMLEWIWSNFLLMLNGVWNINTCPVERRNNSISFCELDEEGFAIYKTSLFNSAVKLLNLSNKTASVMLSRVAHGFHSSTRVQRQVDFHECEDGIVHIVSPRLIKAT